MLGSLMAWSKVAAIDLGTIGPTDKRGKRFGYLGDGAALLWPQGSIYNEHCLSVGAGTLIGPNVCLTAGMAPGQQMVTNPVVSIGERCIIGRGSHIIGHWSITLGDDIQTGPYVYITDQNHVYLDPDEPIGRQWPVEAAVSIGSGSWLGANVVILPGTTIGEHCVVAAGAVVRGTIPDHCVVAGVPAKIVRRYDRTFGWTNVDHQSPSLEAPEETS
jgi:serine acetyltransferase